MHQPSYPYQGITTEEKSEERLVPTFLLRTPEWHTQHSSLISSGEHLHGNINVQGKVVAMRSAQTFSERPGERLVRRDQQPWPLAAQVQSIPMASALHQLFPWLQMANMPQAPRGPCKGLTVYCTRWLLCAQEVSKVIFWGVRCGKQEQNLGAPKTDQNCIVK